MNWDEYFSWSARLVREMDPRIETEIVCPHMVDNIRYICCTYTMDSKIVLTERIRENTGRRGDILKLEKFDADGTPHCDWNFPSIGRNPCSLYDLCTAAVINTVDDGHVFRWLHNGKPRENGHTDCKYTKSKVVLEWRNNHGQLHSRDDRPARITISGAGLRADWYNQGVIHRCDAPAVKRFYSEKLVGETIPAIFEHIEKLTPTMCEWWHNGNLHREGGEARPREFWRYGICYSPRIYEQTRLVAVKEAFILLPVPIRCAILNEFNAGVSC